MTKTTIIAAALVAGFAFALILAPGVEAYIASTLGLDDAKVKADKKKLKKAKYKTDGKLKTDADTWLGVGEFVALKSGATGVITTASHPGFLDSKKQKNAADGVWHNHVASLKFAPDTACPSGVAVDDLTWKSPGKTKVKNNHAEIKDVKLNKKYKGQFSGLEMKPIALAGTSVLFQLNPVAAPGEVCVEPLGTIPPTP